MENKIQVKYLRQYQHDLKPAKSGDAGIDIVACRDVIINALETKLIGTYLKIEIPKGYYGRLVGRSSLHMEGLHVNEGIIDSGYRGEVKVSMTNLSLKPPFKEIKKGTRVAQLIIQKCEDVEFIPVGRLENSERGNNGFGSTGRCAK